MRSLICLAVILSVHLLLPTRLAGAEPGSERYAETVLNTPGLFAWWRFEQDMNDNQGTVHGQSMPKGPTFVDGPQGGKALELDHGQYATMGQTPNLDLPESTVELWFKATFSNVGYNPCIIAKRADGDHRVTRFSLHIWGDYSCLAIWNGRKVLRYLAGEPLRAGQWYYVAVTSTSQGTMLYLDGVPCDLEASGDSFNFEQRELPLSIGSSQPKGVELLRGAVDEVAIYRRVLSEEEIAAHVDAMGWKERRLNSVEARQARIDQERARQAEMESVREKLRSQMMQDPALLDPGQTTVYRDEKLAAISLPVGGIGSGSIQIDGRAVRHVWQIFNNHKHAFVPHSFFAVRVKADSGEPVVRALQTEPVGPFTAMANLTFRGEYPFGWYQFEDPDVPLRIAMEAFSPLVPLEASNSAIPCAVFNLTAENTTNEPVEVCFLATQQNAVGYGADQPIQGRRYPGYGGNRNEIFRDAGLTILHLSSTKAAGPLGSDDMALMALADEVTATASWESLESLSKQFFETGLRAGAEEAGPSPTGETLDGALGVRFQLAPGQKQTVPFILTWYFPNGPHGSGQWGSSGNMYAVLWPSAFVLARELATELEQLTRVTRLYHKTLYESNLPHWLLDRISSQVAVLRSQTCFWTDEGYFGGWEGCCPESGCCHGNCNHVWHYAQTHARLFPSIARKLREQEFHFQTDDGAIPHRQPRSHAAFDGQCGAVLNSYREHLMMPDGAWLKQHWPDVKKAMQYTIATWDKDQDGVLTGPQWNTLDGALGGNSSWLGTMYLAALAAAEKMALVQDEPDMARRYAAIRASGSAKQDQTLFNGEYYIQIPDPEAHEDYGNGCHIDQVLGQWWAHQLDLGWVYPPNRVGTALESLFEYNFRGRLEGLPQVPRKFVADTDPGMQMITWPKGPRPAKVIRYGDEVMTGFEYSAAAAMVQSGLLNEGLTVARAIWLRYDGRLREGLTPNRTASWGYSGNPFGDDECGKFYARAMSVWSMLLACQGFVYDGPEGRIGFKPVWQPENHASFFTAAEGWGLFRQRREESTQTEKIEVRHGRLRVETLVFELQNGATAKNVKVQLGDELVPCSFECSENETRIRLAQPAIVTEGGVLTAIIGA